MARSIPQIRTRLHELAIELDCVELHELAEETRRHYSGRRAPTKQPKITLEMVDAVRDMAVRYPNMAQRDIGRHFGIDQGRVNEILNGFRDGSSYEARL